MEQTRLVVGVSVRLLMICASENLFSGLPGGQSRDLVSTFPYQ